MIANQLRRALWRVDLSAVESKYIGETEKNLHRLFHSAAQQCTILLFDEADALFGKRAALMTQHFCADSDISLNSTHLG